MKKEWDGSRKEAIRAFLENAIGIALMARDRGVEVTAEKVVSSVVDLIDVIPLTLKSEI